MEARHYWVYNKEMNLIDDFRLSVTDKTTIRSLVGGEKYQYLVYSERSMGNPIPRKKQSIRTENALFLMTGSREKPIEERLSVH